MRKVDDEYLFNKSLIVGFSTVVREFFRLLGTDRV